MDATLRQVLLSHADDLIFCAYR